VFRIRPPPRAFLPRRENDLEQIQDQQDDQYQQEYATRDAIGIDGALQKLAHASYRPYLLGITAAGLVCYGLFCSVDARYRDV
jgi:Domain of Unknown Function (DUF1206)